MVAVVLLPLALVWKQLGRKGPWLVLAVHLGGIAVGLLRYALG